MMGPLLKPAETASQVGKIEWENRIAAWWDKRRGRVLGTAAGLLIGWLVIKIGWWQAATLALFLYIGYAVGGSLDQDDE